MRQSTPHFLILQLIGSTSKNKQRCPALEEEFVNAIIDVMKRTEALAGSTNPNTENEIYRIWNNLINPLINLTFNQNIMSSVIIRQLIIKLKTFKISYKFSRDWLMWFFLQVIAVNASKKQKVKPKCVFLFKKLCHTGFINNFTLFI